ncbi:MAG TPA: DUF924 family protein [Alphaproteobacteria bacterium]
MSAPDALLDFWFGPSGSAERESPRGVWFKSDPAFDVLLRDSFLADQRRAANGDYDSWVGTPEGTVALLLLLDQLPRNLYRGTAQSFATDARAREIAGITVPRGFDKLLPPVWRWFVYLPFEHSESLADQERSLALFGSLPPSKDTDKVVDYARRHHDIVARFGRFPHRNEILGRSSRPEEIEFLKQPGSAF